MRRQGPAGMATKTAVGLELQQFREVRAKAIVELEQQRFKEAIT